jgi:hypothetical protein
MRETWGNSALSVLASGVHTRTTGKDGPPMEMWLMVLCVSLFALAVTGLAFGAATRPEQAAPVPEAEPEAVVKVAAPRFFVNKPAMTGALEPRVPIEALLLQIESHVRLEQAAAESFLEMPTSALLHSRTMSPLVH